MKHPLVLLTIVVAVGVGVWLLSEKRIKVPQPGATPTPTASTPAVSTKPSTSKTPRPSTISTPTPSAVGSVTPTPTPTETVSPAASPTGTPTGTPTPTGVATYNVSIQDSSFVPSPLTVHRGDIVIFQNNTGFTQTVTSLNLMFNSKNIYPGGQWTYDTSGLIPASYEYNSTTHTVIRGTLIVQ